MKRNLATVSAAALLLALSGLAVAQDAGKSKTKSDTIVPIPGTGTAEVKGARLIQYMCAAPLTSSIIYGSDPQ